VDSRDLGFISTISAFYHGGWPPQIGCGLRASTASYRLERPKWHVTLQATMGTSTNRQSRRSCRCTVSSAKTDIPAISTTRSPWELCRRHNTQISRSCDLAAAVDDPSSYHRTISLDMELLRPAAADDDASLSRTVTDMLVLPTFGIRHHHRRTAMRTNYLSSRNSSLT